MCYECDFESFVNDENLKTPFYKPNGELLPFTDTFLDKVREKVVENPPLVRSTKSALIRKIMFDISRDKDFLIKISNKNTIIPLLESHGSCPKVIYLSVYMSRTESKDNSEVRTPILKKRGDASEVYAYRLLEPTFRLCSKHSKLRG